MESPEGKKKSTPAISVCIVCFNEQDNIKRCLESVEWVKDYQGEIVVVDSFSTDNTVEICKQFTDKVIQHKWGGFVSQKTFAVSQAQNDWILSLDADEVISGELREEIIKAWWDRVYHNCDGIRMKRHAFYLGKWINHGGWYPNWQLRLFNKYKGKWGGIDPHDRIVMQPDTKVIDLKNDLLHYTYKDISHQLRTIDNFSRVSSQSLLGEGDSFSIFKMIFRPPVKFMETFLWKRGFLDGMPGFIISVASSFYVFIKYAKMWESTLVQRCASVINQNDKSG